MNATLLVACMGAGMASQLGAARLLFGMGRTNVLPRSFFASVSVKARVPRNNVILVGLLALLGASLFSYSLGAEMLNFGALIAFMGGECRGALALLRACRGEKVEEPSPSPVRWSHLSTSLAQPKPAGHSCRNYLDNRWCRLWRLQNARLPSPLDEL